MMKRTTVFWCILGTALISLGLICFLITMSSVGWKFSAIDGKLYTTNTHTLSGNVTDISLDLPEADISILPLETGEARVVCYEQEGLTHAVSLENGTLSITADDNRAWYDHILSFRGSSITIYLPAGTYSDFTLEADTVDVTLSKDFIFENIHISLTTGDVRSYASALTEINISTTTGDITLRDLTAPTITLSQNTGDADLQGITCHDLTSIGTTGDLEMEGVIAEGNLRVERDTGDVDFEGCDAGYISIQTTTGDIEGSFLTDKSFHTYSSTGDVRVPLGTTGGTCKLSTTTGDIEVFIKGARP